MDASWSLPDLLLLLVCIMLMAGDIRIERKMRAVAEESSAGILATMRAVANVALAIAKMAGTKDQVREIAALVSEFDGGDAE